MVTTRISSTMTSKSGVGDAGQDQQLLRQYISAALGAQTLTGTVKGVVRMASNTANVGVAAPAISISKCSADGSTVTEIVAPTQASDATTSAPPATSGTTLTNRRFETPPGNTFNIPLGSTSISAGERLIVEVGYKDNTTNTGRFGTMSLGDDSSSDLPEDESTTTADNPWVEFSMDLSFSGGGPTGSPWYAYAQQ